MIKLSRTGWNNIIIFAVMGVILLINLTQRPANHDSSSVSREQALFTQSQLILTLEIQQHVTIERIGRTWRSSPALIQGQALEQMMMSWQSLSGKLVEQPAQVDLKMGLVVSLAIAGESDLLQLQLYDLDGTLYIYKPAVGQWYALPLPLFSQLLPAEVF